MDKDSSTLVRWAFVLVAACVYHAPTWAAGPKVSFHIPAGQAPQTLLQFYLQSQVRVLYLADTLKGIETPAVTGELEASEALAQLLRGTGLTYEFDGEHSAVIKRTPGVTPTSQAAKISSPGDGPHVPPTYNARSEIKLQEILVTGTLIHGVLDIMSPLITVDKSDMKRTGYATVQDALQSLPLVALSKLNEEFGGTGNYNRGSAIDLRGIGPGATLVLVDGRRQAVSGFEGDFVDVSTIPWSAVDHIEVLPDGSSALYGSDAIAGVVNIIMRKNLEGAESQVRFGTARDGAAETIAAQLFGHEWSTGKFLFDYQYSNRTALAAADRPYAADSDKGPLGGRNYSSVSSNPANILDPATFQPLFAIPFGQDGRSLTPAQLQTGTVHFGNRFANVELLPDKQVHSFFVAASQNLGQGIELFTEGRYARLSISQRPQAPDFPLTVVPPTNPFYVDAYGGSMPVILAYDFSKDFGPFAARGETQSYSGTLGLQARISDSWRAVAATSYGDERMLSAYWWMDSNALNAALADPNPATAFNPFGDGSYTNPATLSAIKSIVRWRAESSIASHSLIVDGPVFRLPTGETKLALGIERRRETLSRILPQSGSEQFGRNITAAFAELSLPLMANSIDSSSTPRLGFSLAGRYEKSSDFGSTFNPKIGLQWAPLKSAKLRASWGTSFKAPKLADLYSTTSNADVVLPLADPKSTSGRSLVLARQGSNRDLKEETATTWTAGLDLTPSILPGFSLSATGYVIEYKDQVIQPGPLSPFDTLLHEDEWSTIITRNPSQAEIDRICNGPTFVQPPSQCLATPPTVIVDIRLRNLATTRMKGLDVKLDQLLDTTRGHFNFGIEGSYIFSLEQAVTNSSPEIDILDTVYNPPALRLRGTAKWNQYGPNRAGWAVDMSVNHTGSYRDAESTLHPRIDAYTTLDVGLSYRTENGNDVWDNVELFLNTTNVFDKDPPFVDREWGYDVFNAKPLGRVISLFVQKNW